MIHLKLSVSINLFYLLQNIIGLSQMQKTSTDPDSNKDNKFQKTCFSEHRNYKNTYNVKIPHTLESEASSRRGSRPFSAVSLPASVILITGAAGIRNMWTVMSNQNSSRDISKMTVNARVPQSWLLYSSSTMPTCSGLMCPVGDNVRQWNKPHTDATAVHDCTLWDLFYLILYKQLSPISLSIMIL